MIDAFARILDRSLLENVRVNWGRLPHPTLQGLTNELNANGARNHAVTTGNLIVIANRVDLTDPSFWEWLLHEIRHVQQYAEKGGIRGFAREYARDHGALERDAYRFGEESYQRLVALGVAPAARVASR